MNTTTRRHPRTMTAAFGPYTSQQLDPMPEPRARRWADIALYAVSIVAVIVLAALPFIER